MPIYIRARTPVDGWTRVIGKIMNDGVVRIGERGLKTRWLDNVMVHLVDPFKDRVSEKYPFSEKVLREKYATQLLTPDRLDFEYTYGERLNAWGSESINQVDYVVEKLKKSPHSRRAVANLWDPRKDPNAEEVPCLNHFVFMKRNGVLDVSVMIRSNDMYGAWPANIYALAELLQHVSERVAIQPGSITTLSVNAHIYDHDWEEASRL
ncbi:MAG: thymidylate synthase [Candidatus Thorarchaeota archaeon]